MKTILVIEDTRAERKLISALLTQAGFNVVGVGSVEAAWEWLESNPLPSLILLDIILPGENGLEFCRQLNSHSESENIPIVFCSSKAQEFDRMWAMRQGGSDYITKPYAPQNLIDTVFKNIESEHNEQTSL